MKPYYEDSLCTIYNGDCREIAPTLDGVTVTDPPYNVGYHYNDYKDNLSADEYSELLRLSILSPCVIVAYHEAVFAYSLTAGVSPDRTAVWCYNANTPRQHRMIAWYGCNPDFNLVRQRPKNPTDKRVSGNVRIYDWWEIQQVKNVSNEKTDHPCQTPEAVFKNIIGVTPSEKPYIDPFMGSGTLMNVCSERGRKSIGIEQDERYCEIAAKRLQQKYLLL